VLADCRSPGWNHVETSALEEIFLHMHITDIPIFQQKDQISRTYGFTESSMDDALLLIACCADVNSSY